MANKNQIMIVKTIRKRLIELLGDSKVSVTVSYTSASDTLKLTFKKILKGAAFELPICTFTKEYLLNPETLQYIVTDALDKMPKPPKWTMETVLAEMRRRYYAYRDYIETIPRNSLLRQNSSIGAGFTSTDENTQAYYSMCGNLTSRNYALETSDLDLFESSFERDAGLASGGEYTRWREAGEPKRWTDPTEVRHVVPGRPDIDIRSVTVQYSPRETAAANNWSPVPTPDPTNWGIQGAQVTNTWIDEIHEFRVYDSVADMRPDTLFGLPVIWADELPPATRIQEPTNE